MLEEYVHFRDNLKVLLGVIVDEVWKHCHLSNNFKIGSSFKSSNQSQRCYKPKTNEISPAFNKFSFHDQNKEDKKGKINQY